MYTLAKYLEVITQSTKIQKHCSFIRVRLCRKTGSKGFTNAKCKKKKKEDAEECTHVDGLKALYSTLVSPRKTFISTTKDYDVRLAVLRNFGLHGTKYRNNKMFL